MITMIRYLRITCLALVALLVLSSERSSAKEGNPAKRAFKAGQLWRYRTRAIEPDSRILVLRVEQHEKLGEVVHIRITNLKFNGPDGGVSDLHHIPYSGPALRYSLTTLESTGNMVPSEYLDLYREWHKAGDPGVFFVDVANLLNGLEGAVGRPVPSNKPLQQSGSPQ